MQTHRFIYCTLSRLRRAMNPNLIIIPKTRTSQGAIKLSKKTIPLIVMLLLTSVFAQNTTVIPDSQRDHFGFNRDQ